ncbi:methylated-DNA--[protein]-cysteine S-methyltransferase [Helicobacter sp. 23-1045]
MQYFKTHYDSPLGNITLSCDDRENIVGLWFKGQKYFCDTIKGEMIKNDNLRIFTKAKKWLDRYFGGKKPDIAEITLSPNGNDFRQRVWKILCKIPYGKVYTYGEVAKIIAKEQCKARMSAQAVGGAVGRNPISIIIPCHRVVGADGKLTGYANGIETKIKLLKLEGVNMTKYGVDMEFACAKI